MKLVIPIALLALMICGIAGRILRRGTREHPDSTPEGGLFSTRSEHLTVRSADNVRLLSDAQLRALEDALDPPEL